ncbi:hypothetical protein NP233_g11910 [Leucocoprinus birnbaumii]|uniref:Uncharacterized protein n=1 Tax=Leucocoprinus birnbaumii TaxID=56174 RepID=A0AAD5VLA8_9AGAR|nr:hypothetical protein NP233_g11910 [Leucocoprinus birnbaumii]
MGMASHPTMLLFVPKSSAASCSSMQNGPPSARPLASNASAFGVKLDLFLVDFERLKRNCDFLSPGHCPGAPLTRTTQLPDTPYAGSSMDAVEFLPLSLSAPLTASQTNLLRRIPLVSPVHLHVLVNSVTHFGTFYGEVPGEQVSALDLFIALRSLSSQPLCYQNAYYQLSETLKSGIRSTFLARNGHKSNAYRLFQQFTSGHQPYGGPTGHDFLLGKQDIWGFESVSLDGHGIVHLA